MFQPEVFSYSHSCGKREAQLRITFWHQVIKTPFIDPKYSLRGTFYLVGVKKYLVYLICIFMANCRNKIMQKILFHLRKIIYRMYFQVHNPFETSVWFYWIYSMEKYLMWTWIPTSRDFLFFFKFFIFSIDRYCFKLASCILNYFNIQKDVEDEFLMKYYNIKIL